MVFSSTEFLWFFLPIVLALYYVVYLFEKKSNKIKNGLLLVASLLFYAWGEPKYILLMLISILLNYVFGLAIHRWHSKGILALSVCVNIGLLCIFKYLNFFAANVNMVLHTNYLTENPIPLPIGISFYTFQALSYVIDVYKKKIHVQKNPFDLALYIAFFPQLIAGPIVKYKEIETQLKVRTVSIEKMSLGIRRFIIGLGKKTIISNTCADVADSLFSLSAQNLSTPAAWLGIICYLFQIYYDFGGYSDMAIGLGKMFGFDFSENFNFPYLATSIKDFWRRWHISLSSWFRDYLYIPLGGNRKGNLRTYINLLIVFFCTGFWHGASWNFIVWGLFHGAFQLLERGKWGKVLNEKLPRMVQHVYALLVVTTGWVFFRAANLSQALAYIKQMFLFQKNGTLVVSQHLNVYTIVIILLAIVFCGLFQKFSKKIYGKYICNPETVSVADIIFCIGIAVFSGMLIICGTYNPFIYFQF